jgi:cold shock CspA family protein
MTKGSVTKLVKTFGSTWGRIQPDGDSREIFFNVASLVEPADFPSMTVGQDVEFDEQPDQVNGAHAERVVLTSSSGASSGN